MSVLRFVASSGWRVAVALCCGCVATAMAADEARPAGEPKAVLIRLEGPINTLLESFLSRKLEIAQRDGAELIILEIDSPGGDAEASFEIAERLSGIDWARTVAYIPAEALSGAAVVALGCDEILMGPNAVLGDVGVITLGEDFLFRYAPEKVQSHYARRLRDLAEARQRPGALAEAMVYKDHVVYHVKNRQTGEETFMTEHEIQASGTPELWDKGKPVLESGQSRFLEVNGRRAVELGLADVVIADREALRTHCELTADPPVLQPGGVDVAVHVLNNPWVTGLLMVIGLIALYVEVSSPGLSVGGLIALLCFALFFWSRFLGGTAEVLELVIFLVGILFLAAEIFVFPGFGVAGVTGLLLMGLGVLMASQTFVIPQTQRQFDTFSISLLVLACSALVFLVAAVVISRYFGSLPVFNRLVLQPATATGGAAGKPAKSQRGKPALDALPIAEVDVGVGDWGMALSALRPAGKARFGDEVLDVLTDGDFIEAGRQVRIVELEGNRIVVADVEHG